MNTLEAIEATPQGTSPLPSHSSHFICFSTWQIVVIAFEHAGGHLPFFYQPICLVCHVSPIVLSFSHVVFPYFLHLVTLCFLRKFQVFASSLRSLGIAVDLATMLSAVLPPRDEFRGQVGSWDAELLDADGGGAHDGSSHWCGQMYSTLGDESHGVDLFSMSSWYSA